MHFILYCTWKNARASMHTLSKELAAAVVYVKGTALRYFTNSVSVLMFSGMHACTSRGHADFVQQGHVLINKSQM